LTALTGGVTIPRKDVPSRAAERVDFGHGDPLTENAADRGQLLAEDY
jgi:hypothetical protein